MLFPGVFVDVVTFEPFDAAAFIRKYNGAKLDRNTCLSYFADRRRLSAEDKITVSREFDEDAISIATRPSEKCGLFMCSERVPHGVRFCSRHYQDPWPYR